MKHTQGPWISNKTPSGNLFVYANGLKTPIAGCGLAANEQVQANAALIAAAPELLAACIEATALFDNYPELFSQIGTFQVLNNAIAKACGSAPYPV